MDNNTPCVSFIGIVDFSQEAKWIYMTESVTDLLGFEPKELVGRPSLELVHPDEFGRVRQLHYDTITQDKAAVLVYLRLRHKDPYKGYVLCGIVRYTFPAPDKTTNPTNSSVAALPTVVHNLMVGSVSFASPGAKALHNASTAQEITVISPTTHNFQFRRWNDPSPMPPSPTSLPSSFPSPSPAPPLSPWQSPSPVGSPSPTLSPRTPSAGNSPTDDRTSSQDFREDHPYPPRHEGVITFDHMPNQSFRTAFIVDRFSMNCTIFYCSNDLLVSSSDCVGRSFFDYVTKKDETQVRSWIDCVKGWGVNERGQPSDGGFGFGRFLLITEGRESIDRIPEPSPTSRKSRSARSGGPHGPMTSPNRHRPKRRGQDRDSDSPPLPTVSMNDVNSPQFPVDAIFSAHSDGLMIILRRATA